jgi:hypothetical protein
MGAEPVLSPKVMLDVRQIVDTNRVRCLWFLRPDFYPETAAEILRVLSLIERQGDRDAFVRSAEIRQWLSPNSSARSVVS